MDDNRLYQRIDDIFQKFQKEMVEAFARIDSCFAEIKYEVQCEQQQVAPSSLPPPIKANPSAIVLFSHGQQLLASAPLILGADPDITRPMDYHNVSPQATIPCHHNLAPQIMGYPNTKPVITPNEEALRRRSTYSRTLLRTTKEEEDILFSLFGLRKGKRHFLES